MKKNVKNLIVSAVAMSMFSCVAGAFSLNASAAKEIKSDAFVLLREENVNGESEKTVRYEGTDFSDNTISKGVTTASVSKDDSYTVSIDMSKESDFESIAEIGILQLYVYGTEETALASVEIVVDSLKIDGNEVNLSGNPEMSKSSETGDYYVDLFNTNGTKLFDNTEYQNISEISIDFTVKGWPVAEEETEAQEETEAPTEEKTEEKKEDDKKTEDKKDDKITEIPVTGDAGVAGVLAIMALASSAAIVLKNKE